MFSNTNRREFQRGLDCDKARASRRDAQLSLRRKNREAHLQKKVRLNQTNKPNFYGETKEVIPPYSDIGKYVANIMQTDNMELQLIGLTAIRQMLSVERNPPTHRVLKSGVIPKIIQFMITTNNDRNNNNFLNKTRNKIKFESAWIITNIAASTSECTRSVCKDGAIEAFVDLLRNAVEPELADQAIWGLGNIAGDSKELRDRIIRTNVMNDLVKALPNWQEDMQQNAIWTISNIFRYSRQLKLSDINTVVPAICKLIRETKEESIIRDCLWCFSYLSNQNDDICYYLVENGVIADCMKLLHQEIGKYSIALNQAKSYQHKLYNNNNNNNNNRNTTKEAILKMNGNIYRPSLRCIGNILSGTDELTQKVLDSGYLDIIEPFANHFCSAQRKETIWAISNICAGSHQQIEYVLSRPQLISAIMDAAQCDTLAVRREACWCICNAAADAIGSQIKLLVQHGAIEALCSMLGPNLNLSEHHIICIVEGLEAFLKVYGAGIGGNNSYNPHADQIEECHGLDYLEERMADNNLSEETYNLMVTLVEKYWGRDDELIQCDQIETISLNANIDRNTNQFMFGTNKNILNNENNSIIGNQQIDRNNIARFQF